MSTLPKNRRNANSDPKLPSGTNFSKCSACRCHFLNVRAFEVHRQGHSSDRFCMPTPHMDTVGLELDLRGYWRSPKVEFLSTVAGVGTWADV